MRLNSITTPATIARIPIRIPDEPIELFAMIVLLAARKESGVYNLVNLL
jgi:hypothetical protein